MIAAATNLLSPEEGLATLDSTVFPLEARPDLICDGPDGRLLISKKGRQFYTAAFRRGGIVVDFASIRAAKDLRKEVVRGSEALCVVADTGMRVELDAGRIPVQRREVARAYLDGSVQEFMAAAERLEVCAAAGENVVPVGFGRSAAKIRGA